MFPSENNFFIYSQFLKFCVTFFSQFFFQVRLFTDCVNFAPGSVAAAADFHHRRRRRRRRCRQRRCRYLSVISAKKYILKNDERKKTLHCLLKGFLCSLVLKSRLICSKPIKRLVKPNEQLPSSCFWSWISKSWKSNQLELPILSWERLCKCGPRWYLIIRFVRYTLTAETLLIRPLALAVLLKIIDLRRLLPVITFGHPDLRRGSANSKSCHKLSQGT